METTTGVINAYEDQRVWVACAEALQASGIALPKATVCRDGCWCVSHQRTCRSRSSWLERKGLSSGARCARPWRSTASRSTASRCRSALLSCVARGLALDRRFVVDIVEDVSSPDKIVTEGLFRKPSNAQRAKQDQARNGSKCMHDC